MKSVNKETQMKKLDELKEEIKKAKDSLAHTKKQNAELQDEVDSLWAMMDEMAKSDVENWVHLVDELKNDVVSKALMVTKKADC